MKKMLFLLFCLSCLGSFLQADMIKREYFFTNIMGKDQGGWLDEKRFREKYHWSINNPVNVNRLSKGDLAAWKKDWFGHGNHRRAAIFQGTFHTQDTRIGNNKVNTGLSVEELDSMTSALPSVSTEPYFNIIFYDPSNEKLSDIRYLQTLPELKFATFQVASTFNALEGGMGRKDALLTNMVKHAVQGEEAAIACAGATIYRKYFMYPINLLSRLFPNIKMFAGNGYASIDDGSLEAVAQGTVILTDVDIKKVGVGLHQDIVVTSGYGEPGSGEQEEMPVVLDADGISVDTDKTQIVSQVFTAALDTGKLRSGGTFNENTINLAKMLLKGSYEGTLKAAFFSGKPKVVLTLMGGGAFRNDLEWIFEALNQQHLKDFIKEKGLQVTILFRPDKKRDHPVRTAPKDILFIQNLLQIADGINGTNYAGDSEIKQDIESYVNPAYDNPGSSDVSTYAQKLQRLFPNPFSKTTPTSSIKQPTTPAVPVTPINPVLPPVAPPQPLTPLEEDDKTLITALTNLSRSLRRLQSAFSI